MFRHERARDARARVARAALLFECGADIGCRYIAIRRSKYPIDRSLSRVSVTIPWHPYRSSSFPSLSFQAFLRASSADGRQFRILAAVSSPSFLSVLSVNRVHTARARARLSRTAPVTRDNEPTSAHTSLVSLDPTIPTNDRSRVSGKRPPPAFFLALENAFDRTNGPTKKACSNH